MSCIGQFMYTIVFSRCLPQILSSFDNLHLFINQQFIFILEINIFFHHKKYRHFRNIVENKEFKVSSNIKKYYMSL